MADPVAAVVWLGLGSPTTSRAAQVQLALGLALRRHLGSSARAVAMEAFDPFFTPADGALLAALGVRVQLANRSGACVAAVPTVFIMPHCVRTLYDNVVRANLAHLDRVCIFGNDLHRMAEDQAQAFPYLALVSACARACVHAPSPCCCSPHTCAPRRRAGDAVDPRWASWRRGSTRP